MPVENLPTPIEPVRHVLSGIPFYAFYEGTELDRSAPYVFVIHGFGSNSTYIFDQCEALARQGVTAIAFDQRNHGARMHDPMRNGRWEACRTDEDFCDMLSDMYMIMRGSAQDVSLLIDGLALRFGMTTDKIGITGTSLGGHVSFIAMERDTRIAVAAPLIGSASFAALSAHRVARYGRSLAYFEEYKAKKLMPLLKRYDPIENVNLFADRPLFMANGKIDDIVPTFCNEGFYEKAVKVYKDPSRIVLKEYEEVAHQVPSEMQNEANAWLLKYLEVEPKPKA